MLDTFTHAHCVPQKFLLNMCFFLLFLVQALAHMGNKVRQRATWGRSRSKVDEARELLAGTILAHVPVRSRWTHSTSKCVHMYGVFMYVCVYKYICT